MIKIFITVGTTPFDELIKFCDQNINTSLFDVTAQISNISNYKTQNIKAIEFTKNIKELYEQADIIISHAGAGSIYNLLEMNKKCIFVPNFTMKDNHQEDICKFINNHNYATILNLKNLIDINNLLLKVMDTKYNLYKKPNSKKLIEEIINIINT